MQKVSVGFSKAMGMIYPYLKKRILEQIQAVWLIVIYLVAFQTLVLRIPIAEASVISLGIVLVVSGLTFFMEGLLLGLMPLGETIGIKLPEKSKLPVILIFSFILGVGATFAEPAIGVLKAAGSSVTAWDAPLLFLILNKYSSQLVNAVGVGVGLAVLFGMLRFMYSWSLKPFIYILVTLLSVYTVIAYFEPNLLYVTGLAWDCGAVTTGPVTVPLVLALGIGITRMVSKDDGGSAGGFGVVTLASAFPIITVLLLGTLYVNSVPAPMTQEQFFSDSNRQKALFLFEDKNELEGYLLKNGDESGQKSYFGTEEAMGRYFQEASANPDFAQKIFGGEQEYRKWYLTKATAFQKEAIYGSKELAKEQLKRFAAEPVKTVNVLDSVTTNFLMSAQAIIPLSLFLFLTLVLVLREKLKKADEIALGLAFAVLGMTLFNIGIEYGLSKLGAQVGEKIPSSFKTIRLPEQSVVIKEFDHGIVQKAMSLDGSQKEFFYANIDNQIVALDYDKGAFNEESDEYTYVPVQRPLYSSEGGIVGIGIVLIFAFIMGYGATLAEPALNALGLTVEELTVGAFKKSTLIQTVAVGVGFGIAFGVAKIIWDIPLVFMLVPPYLVLLVLTKLSTEDFVNIGWDSAGVTTGPITVPLVLAMGLGISANVGVVEGFGILAMASVMPILAVITMGLIKQRSAVKA